jgi:hypothetical protein
MPLPPPLSNERSRVRDACRAAETEKAGRRGLEGAPRVTLRRAVATAAAASSTAAGFFARLDAAGITVRQRHSAKN